MLTRVILLATAAGLLSVSAAAQGPVIAPDDFIDPKMGFGTMFLSRATIGGVLNPSSHYRLMDGNLAAVLITNSLYIGKFQFDYWHAEVRGGEPAPVKKCDCPGGPVYFPTPPLDPPPGPPPGRSETLLVGGYYTMCQNSPSPCTLRFRLSLSRQSFDVPVTSTTTGQVVERRSAHDQSVALDADTHFRIGERDVWGSVHFARTSLSGTPQGEAQNELVYANRFAGWYVRDVLLRPTVRIGGLTGRGATGLNVINPDFEALWYYKQLKANLRVVWSAELTRSHDAGWRTNHQLAVFLDHKLYRRSFGGQPTSR